MKALRSLSVCFPASSQASLTCIGCLSMYAMLLRTSFSCLDALKASICIIIYIYTLSLSLSLFLSLSLSIRCHILLLEHSNAQGRHICASDRSMSMRELVEFLTENEYGKYYNLPKMDLACKVGNLAVKLGSYMEETGTGQYLRSNIGRKPQLDNSKIKVSERDSSFPS